MARPKTGNTRQSGRAEPKTETGWMNSIQLHDYGGPEALLVEKVPKPVPKPNEILVQVYAAGVNPVDIQIREGQFQSFMPFHLPMIPGWELSGIVESIGEQVRLFKPGDAIYAVSDLSKAGADAEFMTLAEEEAALKPKSLDYVHAASVPLDALSAWQALISIARISKGQKVLIHDAASGIGHFAVQLAKWKRAVVIATAASKDIEFVYSCGADDVVDYEKMRFEYVMKPHDIDIVLDLIGGKLQDRSWDLLKKGGTLISTVSPPSEELAKQNEAKQTMLSVHPDREALLQIAKLIDTGRLKPDVAVAMPLVGVRKAQELVKTPQIRGKVVLQIVE